jgi:hypothetical protein
MPLNPPLKQRSAPQPARLRGALALLALVVALTGADAGAQEPDSAGKVEYQVKAGFLANFGKLTEWPLESERATNAFRIGVLDDGTALEIIRETLAGKQVKGRAIEVLRLETGADIKAFEMVFVTRAAGDQWKELLRQVGDAPVLTVGECEPFARAGGRINFILKDQKVRFEVNLESANEAGLKISSKVASMATVVRRKGVQP